MGRSLPYRQSDGRAASQGREAVSFSIKVILEMKMKNLAWLP